VVTEPRFVDRLLTQLDSATPLYVLPRHAIERLAGFNFHRGVLSCGYRPAMPALSELMREAPPRAVLAVCVGI
jgi:hypothetical protein